MPCSSQDGTEEEFLYEACTVITRMVTIKGRSLAWENPKDLGNKLVRGKIQRQLAKDWEDDWLV